MELYAHWIYGLHPSDEMILGYISPGNMFFSELDGKIASAVAVVPRQEKEYHDVPWKMNPADDAARTMRAVIEMSRESGKKAVHLDALKCNTSRPPPLRIARLFPGRRKKLAYRKRKPCHSERQLYLPQDLQRALRAGA